MTPVGDLDRRALLKACAAAAVVLGLSHNPALALNADVLPSAFNVSRHALVSALADTIIPDTDTQGAVKSGVVDFIDLMVAGWMDSADREAFLAGLDAFDVRARKILPQGFVAMKPAQRLAFLKEVQAETTAARRPDKPVSFFLMAKRLVVFGYYTSITGASEELTFNLVPGEYQPCAHVDHDMHAFSISRLGVIFPLKDTPSTF